MQTPNSPIHGMPHKTRLHPMLLLAAVAIILFCLLGAAAILGWIPSSVGNERDRLSEYDKAALAAKMNEDSTRAASPALAMAPTELPPAAPPALAANLREPEPAVRERVREEPAPRVRQHEPARVAQRERDDAVCRSCGRVESVRAIRQRAEGSGLGAGAGAVLGGLLGHQIGGGNGKKIATAAGAVGGAVIGNQVEGNMRAVTSYEIRVRLDNGSHRTFHTQNPPRWESGDRVRVVNGGLRSI